MVNLGGDIAVSGKKRDRSPWNIGIENTSEDSMNTKVIQVRQGAESFLEAEALRFFCNRDSDLREIQHSIQNEKVSLEGGK